MRAGSACFAALLGDEDAGRWRLAPAAAESASSRRYRGDSLVLETDWRTADGEVRMIDFMPPPGEAADMVRIVEGRSVVVPMRMSIRLRFDHRSVVPWVRRQGRDWVAVAGPDSVWLRAGIPLNGPVPAANVGDRDTEIHADSRSGPAIECRSY